MVEAVELPLDLLPKLVVRDVLHQRGIPLAAPRVEQRDGVGGESRRDVELPVGGFTHINAAGEEDAAAGDGGGVGGLADGEGRVRGWCCGVGGGIYCGGRGHWGGVVGGHCGCCAATVGRLVWLVERCAGMSLDWWIRSETVTVMRTGLRRLQGRSAWLCWP